MVCLQSDRHTLVRSVLVRLMSVMYACLRARSAKLPCQANEQSRRIPYTIHVAYWLARWLSHQLHPAQPRPLRFFAPMLCAISTAYFSLCISSISRSAGHCTRNL